MVNIIDSVPNIPCTDYIRLIEKYKDIQFFVVGDLLKITEAELELLFSTRLNVENSAFINFIDLLRSISIEVDYL